MMQGKAKLADPYIRYRMVYKDGKFGFIGDSNGFTLFEDGLSALARWHIWCDNQETVDMANVYLKLLED